MINAQRHTIFGAGHGIVSAEQANFAAFAQKAIKLRGARVICDWSEYARPRRTPQSDVRVAG